MGYVGIDKSDVSPPPRLLAIYKHTEGGFLRPALRGGVEMAELVLFSPGRQSWYVSQTEEIPT